MMKQWNPIRTSTPFPIFFFFVFYLEEFGSDSFSSLRIQNKSRTHGGLNTSLTDVSQTEWKRQILSITNKKHNKVSVNS